MKYIGKDPDILANSVTVVASGNLADGSKVIINSNGTVSVAAESSTSISQAIGTPALLDGGNKKSEYNSVVFDSNSNRIVIAYKDTNDSNKGKAVVGTINPSNNSISLGTSVVFNANSSEFIDAVFDSINNKVVILWREIPGSPTGLGYGITGTVNPSDNSISFGSKGAFSGDSGAQYIRGAFDASSGKILVTFRANNNNHYGTCVVCAVNAGVSPAGFVQQGSAVVYRSVASEALAIVSDSNAQKVLLVYGSSSKGFARVGTVSGQSISFGTEAEFFSVTIQNTAIAFDSNSNKSVIFFADQGSGGFQGKARVATISGTNVSFGTTAQFESGNINIGAGVYVNAQISAAFDSSVNKVIVTYQDGGNSSRATAAVGTISGTNISFATPFVFDSTDSKYFGMDFDSTNKRMLVAYRDVGDSDKATTTVIRVGGTEVTTNLTAENYIGISDAAYTSGQDATVQLAGSVDDAQTSLTAGQTYFVQTDGTLGTSAGVPSVVAGTAVASTKLIVKG